MYLWIMGSSAKLGCMYLSVIVTLIHTLHFWCHFGFILTSCGIKSKWWLNETYVTWIKMMPKRCQTDMIMILVKIVPKWLENDMNISKIIILVSIWHDINPWWYGIISILFWCHFNPCHFHWYFDQYLMSFLLHTHVKIAWMKVNDVVCEEAWIDQSVKLLCLWLVKDAVVLTRVPSNSAHEHQVQQFSHGSCGHEWLPIRWWRLCISIYTFQTLLP